MKKLFLIPLLLLTVMSFAACGGSDDEPNTPEVPEQPEIPSEGEDGDTPGENGRCLVVYFSHTGTTERIANEIHSMLNCDMVKVTPQTPYPSGSAIYDRAHAEQDAIDAGNFPTINTTVESFEQYDLILVGYPIWSNRIATAMQSFLHNHAGKLSGNRIALFASSGGSSITNSASEAQRLVPEASFVEETLLNVFDRTRIADWLTRIGANSSRENDAAKNGE